MKHIVVAPDATRYLIRKRQNYPHSGIAEPHYGVMNV
jgi:hypothetical protein